MLLSYPIPSPSSSSGANLELIGYIHMVQMTHCQQKNFQFSLLPRNQLHCGVLLVAVMMRHKLGGVCFSPKIGNVFF